MTQQRSATNDDARQKEKAKARKERGTKGREKRGAGGGAKGTARKGRWRRQGERGRMIH